MAGTKTATAEPETKPEQDPEAAEQAPRPSAPPAAAPAPASDPAMVELMTRLLEQQQKQGEAILGLMERQADETTARERAAAEAAASKKLPPAEDEVEEGFEPVVFRSKGDAFRVVRVGRVKYTAPNGVEEVITGRAYQFVHGGLGLSELRVMNSDVANFLRGRPTYCREFWEVGKEPDAPPNPQVVMERVIAATVALDDERLGELLELEEASHQRPVVLSAIKAARRQIRGQE